MPLTASQGYIIICYYEQEAVEIFKKHMAFSEFMVQRTGGFRRKTRQKLKKHVRNKGKIAIRHQLQEFNEGERVQLKADAGVQHGMYHPRFHGSSGIITGTQGNCYLVAIKDGNSDKTALVHPVHLRKAQ